MDPGKLLSHTKPQFELFRNLISAGNILHAVRALQLSGWSLGLGFDSIRPGSRPNLSSKGAFKGIIRLIP
jgi:hypothetical protein